MSILASAVTSPSVNRLDSAKYHPTIWGDHFLTYASDEPKTTDASIQQHEALKQEVRRMLMENTNNPLRKLHLIDAVQRFGVAYHFNNEIEDILEKISCGSNDYENYDLYNTALRFRLLRQQGIKASCETFKKFKDNEGKFQESLIQDVVGMLSLYEAAHLGIRGEDILDEARAFTTVNLQLVLPKLGPHLGERVSHALNRPIRKCLPRLEARHHINTCTRDESHNATLLNFAKLDFNMLQELHQKELGGVTKWWKILDVKTKLPYARDRVVECFFWIMGVYFEPQFSLGRKILTKVVALASVMDDTYDNYATYEELELFTEAIQRWDIKAIDLLPEYMKMIYRTLIDVYNEIEESLAEEGRAYCVAYAKEVMKRQARVYFDEAKWKTKAYVPTVEEYMKISKVSTGYPMLALTSFLGMGKIASKDSFEWILNDPKIVMASSVISRLTDDIESHKFEQKRDHIPSSVECCMKEHGVSEKEAIKLLQKEITDAWKDINEECLKPTPVPMPLLERILNFSRAMNVIYKDGDGYTNSHILKDSVALLLKDPIF